MTLIQEFILFYSVMFLPGLLTTAAAVDPAGWNSISYNLTVLAVAVPQTLLVVAVSNLRTPGFASRLGWKRPAMRDVVTLALTGAFLLAGAGILSLVISVLGSGAGAPAQPAVRWSFTRYGLTPLVVASCIAVGYREEIFYRAYMYERGTDAGFHPAAVVAVSTLIFATGHIYQGWLGFLVTLGLGAVLGSVYAWRRSLHGIAIAHGLYNAAVLLFTSQSGIVD